MSCQAICPFFHQFKWELCSKSYLPCSLVADLVRQDLRAGQTLVGVIIISINGILTTGQTSFARRHLESGDSHSESIRISRRLEEESELDIEYELLLQEIITPGIDPQDLANKFYESVTESMQEQIDSGALVTKLELTAEELDVVVELAVSNSDFSQLVLVVLNLVSIWYPAWTSGKYCLNDGGQRK